MKNLTIKTDNKMRDFLYFSDLSEKDQKAVKSDYDHLFENGEDTGFYDGWIKYRGSVYHISDFLWSSNILPFPDGWEGYKSNGFFGGVLIKVSDDREQYTIASYYH